MIRRTHHAMRRFVAEIVEAMHFGMCMTEAQRRMTDRGVPYRVQCRIVDHR